jgi:ABC-2 type transport system ATP-binding protein
MIAISIKELTKKYKERFAVKQLTFDVFEGEFFALLGFNGAGKTTTINMLTGISQPTSGDAFIFSRSIVEQMSEIKRDLNVSPQETAIAPNLSVFENLVFIAEIYGFDKKSAQEKANEMLSRFQLEDRKHEKSRKLSGGLKRRLSVAMALITNPKIVFLDEPTLGLDIKSRRELWQILRELKGKVTIVLTTHYLDEVEALADRIAIINRGELKIVGDLDSLREKSKLYKLEDIFISFTEGEGVA